jgi:hypothetical protein
MAAERRRIRWARNAFTILSAALVVAAGVVLYARLPSFQTTTVSGTVRCSSGRAVQGVWIAEAQGAGGFASWSAESGDAALARYAFDIRGRRFAVHVGCGGSPERWQHEVRSDYVARTAVNFVCYDEPTRAQFGRCTPAA